MILKINMFIVDIMNENYFLKNFKRNIVWKLVEIEGFGVKKKGIRVK